MSKLDGASDTPLRARANRELGLRFAHLLATLPHSHQLGVCAELRIPWRTHMRWMATDAEEGSDVAEYQAEVMAALAKQRAKDLDDIDTAVEVAEGSKASTVWNVRKHRHESRFKRFYEDAAPLKVAMTDSEGNDLATVPTTALIGMLAQTKEGDGE